MWNGGARHSDESSSKNRHIKKYSNIHLSMQCYVHVTLLEPFHASNSKVIAKDKKTSQGASYWANVREWDERKMKIDQNEENIRRTKETNHNFQFQQIPFISSGKWLFRFFRIVLSQPTFTCKPKYYLILWNGLGIFFRRCPFPLTRWTQNIHLQSEITFSPELWWNWNLSFIWNSFCGLKWMNKNQKALYE